MQTNTINKHRTQTWVPSLNFADGRSVDLPGCISHREAVEAAEREAGKRPQVQCIAVRRAMLD